MRDEGALFIDALSALGEYTAVFETVFGHKDHYTHTDGPLIENKISFPLGEPDKRISLTRDYVQKGLIPPGALAYPRYKVATLSAALRDIELHFLHYEVNLASRSRVDHLPNNRGSWFTDSAGVPVFYPAGYAVLDWTSRYQGT